MTLKHLKIGTAMVLLAGTPLAAETLTISQSGGSLQEITDRIFNVPFTEATGIEIENLATTDRVAGLQAQQEAGNVVWDIVELSGSDYAIGSREGYFLPLDWSKLDPDDVIPDEVQFEFAAPAVNFAHVYGYREDKMPEGKIPSGWGDFFDKATFPGPRCLQDGPNYNLEVALIADGVDPKDVYTVLATDDGIDRAFAKLDEIKDEVTVWWKSNGQAQQALSDGEVILCTNANGRFKAIHDTGVPVQIAWEDGISLMGFVAATAGTDSPDAAHEYIKWYITDPGRAAEFASIISYPLFTRGAIDLIPEESRPWLPTYPANAEKMWIYSNEFWADNFDDLNERWLEWKLF